MLTRKFTSTCTCKTGLQGEDKRDFKLVKHGDACSGFFGFRHLKGAIEKVKVVQVFLHEIGENSRLQVLSLLMNVFRGILHLIDLISVLEHVFLDTMSMHI